MKKQIGTLILLSTLTFGCGGPAAIVSSSTGFVISKIYNKKYYSGNLTGEKAAVTEVKEEILVSSETTEPKVIEKVEKQHTIAFTLCYLSFFLALSMAAFIIASIYGFVSLNKVKRPRKIKKKRKGRRK